MFENADNAVCQQIAYLAGDKVEATPEFIEAEYRATAIRAYLDMDFGIAQAVRHLSNAQERARHVIRVQSLFDETTFVKECEVADQTISKLLDILYSAEEEMEKIINQG